MPETEDTRKSAKRKPRTRRAIDLLVREAMYIEAESAREAGALGYMCRALVQATMPHSKIAENTFERTNGAFSMVAHSRVGLPYGSVPRLLMGWLTTEALRTKTPVLEMGQTF